MKYVIALVMFLLSLLPAVFYALMLGGEVTKGEVALNNFILPMILYVIPTLLIWRGLIASVRR